MICTTKTCVFMSENQTELSFVQPELFHFSLVYFFIRHAVFCVKHPFTQNDFCWVVQDTMKTLFISNCHALNTLTFCQTGKRNVQNCIYYSKKHEYNFKCVTLYLTMCMQHYRQCGQAVFPKRYHRNGTQISLCRWLPWQPLLIPKTSNVFCISGKGGYKYNTIINFQYLQFRFSKILHHPALNRMSSWTYTCRHVPCLDQLL